MKIAAFTYPSGKFLCAVVAFAAISIGAASATQQEDQIAIQLGGLVLKVDVNNTQTSDADIARALVEGRAILQSTASRAVPVVAGQSFGADQVQTAATRALILEATQKALATPVTRTITRQIVTLSNGRNVTVGATLNPKLTTASAIAAYALNRIPNAAPALAKSAVAAAMKLVNGEPVFNYPGKTPEKVQELQMQDAAKAAGFALSYSLKAYPGGTQNWPPVPRTGPVAGEEYLPNFSERSIPGHGANVQASNLDGLSQAAAAIAANVISGLGPVDGLYGQSTTNVKFLTQSMVETALVIFQYSAAMRVAGPLVFQQNSPTAKGGFVDGVLGVTARSVLNGIVIGAVSENKTDIPLIEGVSQGVARAVVSSYLKACAIANAIPMKFGLFKESNSPAVIEAFTLAGANANLLPFVTTSFEEGWTQDRPYASMRNLVFAGNEGAINGTGDGNPSAVPRNPGIASPVTSTVGK